MSGYGLHDELLVRALIFMGAKALNSQHCSRRANDLCTREVGA